MRASLQLAAALQASARQPARAPPPAQHNSTHGPCAQSVTLPPRSVAATICGPYVKIDASRMCRLASAASPKTVFAAEHALAVHSECRLDARGDGGQALAINRGAHLRSRQKHA